MAWKNVRDHYQVQHNVQVTDAGVCIGSAYIHNIIVIGSDGVVKKRYDMSRTNEDLCRYQREFDADPEKLKELVLSPDTFDKAITVYTYEDGEILEKKCEEPGWPNVTHDGLMMYENTFSADKAKVIEWAKEDAALKVKFAQENLVDAERRMQECKERLAKAQGEQAKLEQDYPEERTDQ